jgi:hypothetical protein
MASGFAAREASSGAVGTTEATLFEWRHIFPFSSVLAFLFLLEKNYPVFILANGQPEDFAFFRFEAYSI